MIKAVIDTNILISGLIWGGSPKKCLDLYLIQNAFQLILSPEIVHEFQSKLRLKFFIPAPIVDKWVQDITLFAQLVIPVYKTIICRDAKDNMILDTALSGNADYIITGDKDLLTLHMFGNVTILTPKAFIQQFKKES